MKNIDTSHYGEVTMGAIASQITSLIIVYSTVYSGADQRKHQSSASLAFVWGIHRGSGNSPHKWSVTRKMFPFDDVIMGNRYAYLKLVYGTMCDHLKHTRTAFRHIFYLKFIKFSCVLHIPSRVAITVKVLYRPWFPAKVLLTSGNVKVSVVIKSLRC